MLLSGNIFTGNSASTGGAGLAAIDTNGGLVSGNRFSGTTGSWIDLRSGSAADGYVGGNVSGWAIVANDFSGSTATTDVLLGTRTSGIVVGKGQDLPIVDDQTGDNDVLESGTGGLFSPAASARGTANSRARALFRQQLHTIENMRKHR